MPSTLVIAFSVSLQPCADLSHNIEYKPYTTNHIITTEEMYDTTKLIEKIFMQEENSP